MVSEAIGSHVPLYVALFLAGRRGREAEATPLIEATVKEALERGEGYAVSAAEWARALLYNGLGRYEDALGAAERASAHPEDLWFHNFGLVELIEAAVRGGRAEHAAEPSAALGDHARAGGTDWALVVEARSRALLSEGEAAARLTAKRSPGSAALASAPSSAAPICCSANGCVASAGASTRATSYALPTRCSSG
jgi:tetratricopeptide (TPR) repeat protein